MGEFIRRTTYFWRDNHPKTTKTSIGGHFAGSSPHKIENNSPKPDMQWSDKQAKLVLVKGEVRGEYAVRFKAQA